LPEDFQAKEEAQIAEERIKQREHREEKSVLRTLPSTTKVVLLALVCYLAYLWMTAVPEEKTKYVIMIGAVLMYVFFFGKSEQTLGPLTDEQLSQILFQKLAWKQAHAFPNGARQIPLGVLSIDATRSMYEEDGIAKAKQTAVRVIDELGLETYFVAHQDIFIGEITKLIKLPRPYDPTNIRDSPSVKFIGLGDITKYKEGLAMVKKQ
jgi:hypothetical protein